ncbi:Mitochondria protein Fmp29 [Penicillium cf. viridicatum]|uniref:Mitochondria protein Fmp29 n=1 Tax=Penicillium cf. viridicatum TaxID=2972119 RepID=A0A9W9MJ73_9EURO|nr:Mitochondria protein Fmp29 [Penicillium cf. viridicatum]
MILMRWESNNRDNAEPFFAWKRLTFTTQPRQAFVETSSSRNAVVSPSLDRSSISSAVCPVVFSDEEREAAMVESEHLDIDMEGGTEVRQTLRGAVEGNPESFVWKWFPASRSGLAGVMLVKLAV